MTKLTDRLFRSKRVKIYDVSREILDERKHEPNPYANNILKNSISPFIYRNNHMFDFITLIQSAFAMLVDGATHLRVYKSFTVKKDYKKVR
tara:strand:- start:137 stop:409 length:273 start_codon:yes stop_codon:yes gene_type:complete